MSLLSLAASAFRRGKVDVDESLRRSLRRQDKLVRRFAALLPAVQWLLLVAGFAYLVMIPTQRLGRGHYISENALQPGHVRSSCCHSGAYTHSMLAWTGQHVLDLGRCARRRPLCEQY